MSYKRILASVFMSLTLVILVILSAHAQDDTNTVAPEGQPATIEFSGPITAINADSILVSGLTVMLGDVAPDVAIVIGNTISVSGVLQADGTIQATLIVIVNDDDDDQDDDTEATPEITPDVTPEMTPEATVEPTATPTPDDDDHDDDRPIIVVHGPVGAINVNIVTIYNINIELDDDDPVLTVIQIGDVIRVEGEYSDDDHDDDDNRDDNDDDQDDHDDDDDSIVIVNVVNITFINVTVIILDGQIWRDPGDCSGLPEWIDDDDAVEYLVRCTGGNSGGGSSNAGGNNNNNNNSNNDDDDDDGGRRNNNRNNRNNDDDDDDDD